MSGNRVSTAVFTTVILLLVAACTPDGSRDPETGRTPSVTAAGLGPQEVLSAEEYLAMPPYNQADRERGEGLYLQCRACHSIEPGGRAMIGPNLYGVFGRKAGQRSGFQYSDALRTADFYWTPRAMDAWITNPSAFLPGHRMSYAGMSRPADRRDLIAWMLGAGDR